MRAAAAPPATRIQAKTSGARWKRPKALRSSVIAKRAAPNSVTSRRRLCLKSVLFHGGSRRPFPIRIRAAFVTPIEHSCYRFRHYDSRFRNAIGKESTVVQVSLFLILCAVAGQVSDPQGKAVADAKVR